MLSDREKWIAGAAYCAGHGDEYYSEDDVLSDLSDKAPSPWVRCDERLPEVGERVLVELSAKAQILIWCVGDEDMVKRWMLIPELEES